MSDNITEQEIWQRYVLFMRIPNETWTDVLKLLSRRILVQNISPACKRLKNIFFALYVFSNRNSTCAVSVPNAAYNVIHVTEVCTRPNKNVDNIHVIMVASWFSEKLRRGYPEANQQLEFLAGNNCQLDSQFRLTRIAIIPENTAILRHCIELFRGCQLSFYPVGVQNAAFFDGCLTQLGPAKPIAIDICLTRDRQLLFNQFLRHPTVWNCSRIELSRSPTFWYVDLTTYVVTFFDWLLHQQPIGVDGSGDGGVGQKEVRCLIIKRNYKIVQGAIDWLINGCIQNFQQSQRPKDRRRFVISFSAWDRDETTRLDQFVRRHNQATGEVLLLEHANADNPRAMVYRLRRCLAEEAANGNEFYGKTFKPNGPWDQFLLNDGPMVGIY